MEEYYTIDRFEENYAVCENRETKKIINIDRSLIPEKASEGVIIRKENGKYIIDYEKTEEVRKIILEKMNKLFNS